MLAGNRRMARSSESIASAYLPRCISAEIFRIRQRSPQPCGPGDLLGGDPGALVVLPGAKERLGLVQVGGGRRTGQEQDQRGEQGEQGERAGG